MDGLLSLSPEEIQKLLREAQTQMGNNIPTAQNFQQKLQQISNPEQMQAIMSNIDVNGMVGGNNKSVFGGGRIGYNQPLNNGRFSAGVSGGGYMDKNTKEFNLGGVDAALSRGDNEISAQYSKGQPSMRGQLPYGIEQNLPVQAPMIPEDLLQLMFRRSF